MKRFDRLAETAMRALASRSSRRGLLALLGGSMVGAGAIPVLPIARAAAAAPTGATVPNPQDPGDPHTCDYWRYCAIDGFLCTCCGGAVNACPPGTEMSPITWIGTCRNPADGRNYIISYNDCCGKPTCGHCFCSNMQGEKPLARTQGNNDTVWCLGTASQAYTCSTAIVVGVATDKKQ
jgi:methylamine dehydrogenase light chain